MSKYYNRRKFIKLSGAAIAGGAAALSGINYGCAGFGSELVVWENPGGDVLSSPDYEVTLKRGNEVLKLFTYYSYNRPVDKVVDAEGDYIKLSFMALHSNEYRQPSRSADTYAHSWTCFDFSGGPVEVEVKILKAFDGLTLPLKSCRVFPSPLGIECQIIADDTIRFIMDKPAKIAIVPNWKLAMEKLGNAEQKQTFEGYRNPLFLFARKPEINIPSRETPGTLVIKPGESYGVEDFNKAKIIYFEAGVHDYSKYNPDDPDHYVALKKGQKVYLAGGSYVYAVFRSDVKKPISEMPLIYGRGTYSGNKQPWTGIPYITTLEKNLNLDGIQIVDAHNHISHSISAVKNVAVVGAWHGNTDGFTRELGQPDPYDGWHVDDCFVMAADTNLKLGGYARARNYTVWQLNNAEPLWLRGTKNITMDGLYVISFNKWRGGQGVVNFSAGERGNNSNATVRNILVEASYIPLIFYMPSSYIGEGVAFDNILFENITVNTPYILQKSPIGSQVKDASPYGKVVFRNLVINGTKVTSVNCTDYFELLDGVRPGNEIVFE
jgi:hypothetical protein